MKERFNSDVLIWVATRTDPVKSFKPQWAPPAWEDSHAAIVRLFGLSTGTHFLRRSALFPNLWERQITEALRALILNDPARVLTRTQALFDALLGNGACQLANVDRITADDSGDRLDLAIYAHSQVGAPCTLLIEAKFQAPLKARQLHGYARLFSRFPRRSRYFFVVAPTKSRAITAAMEHHLNNEWHFVTWKRLLLSWQRTLSDDDGADIPALFSEIWKRAGGS